MSNLKTVDAKGKDVAAVSKEPAKTMLPVGESQALINTNASLHLFDQFSNAFVPKVDDVDVRMVQIGTYKCK
jgi:hypothetical protein